MKALRVLGVAAAIVGAPLPALADAPAIAIAQVTDYHGNMQRCVDYAVDVLRARNFFDNTADDTVNGFAGDDYSILIRCATSNRFVYFVVAGPAYPTAQKSWRASQTSGKAATGAALATTAPSLNDPPTKELNMDKIAFARELVK